MRPQLFFYIFLILMGFPLANAEIIKAYLLPEGETSFNNDEIVLVTDETLDVSNNVITFDTPTTETIGEITIELTQEVTLIADDSNVITLKNTDLEIVTVEIPDKTTIFAPAEWDQTISPPTEVATSGTVSSGYDIPTISIQIGSPDVVLVFDSAVTIILEGTTGQTAYKLSGTDNWLLISGCTGTYDNPDDPSVNGECSISDGTNTKILTYHFTEFAELTETVETTTPETTPETTTTSSGSGSGPGSSSSRGGSTISFFEQSTVSVFPNWFKTTTINWWVADLISDNEFKSIVNYLLDENIIKIELEEKPSRILIDMAPATKHLFNIWSNDKLDERQIISLVQYYRELGIW